MKELFGNETTTIVVSIKFNKPLPRWINIKVVANLHPQRSLELKVDKGEASAIFSAI
ncbi:MAG: hypothetical protein JWQ40_3653 [Segetibacter sp.]|nr:hypothetical protein [Segetibacter sp.]